MVNGFCVHRFNDAQLIRHFRQMGHEIGIQPIATLTHLLEIVDRPCHRKGRLTRGHTGETLSIEYRIRNLLTVDFIQIRLVVEHVDLRRTTRLEKINYSFGLGSEIGKSGKTARRGLRGEEILIQQGGQGNAPSPFADFPKNWRRVIVSGFSESRE